MAGRKKKGKKGSKWIKKEATQITFLKKFLKGFKKVLKRSPESHSSRWLGRIECQQATWKLFSILLPQCMSWFNMQYAVEAQQWPMIKNQTIVMSILQQQHLSSSIHQVYLSRINTQFASIHMHEYQITSIQMHSDLIIFIEEELFQPFTCLDICNVFWQDQYHHLKW